MHNNLQPSLKELSHDVRQLRLALEWILFKSLYSLGNILVVNLLIELDSYKGITS